jgi:nitrogen PTS system EIIA component
VIFDIVGGRPVDFLFLLLVPAKPSPEHFSILPRVARLLRDPAFASELQLRPDQATLYATLLSNRK